METEFDNTKIDSEADAGYCISIFQEGEIVGLLVATTFQIAQELVELVIEEDEEEELDGCNIMPVKFDTLNQFYPVH